MSTTPDVDKAYREILNLLPEVRRGTIRGYLDELYEAAKPPHPSDDSKPAEGLPPTRDKALEAAAWLQYVNRDNEVSRPMADLVYDFIRSQPRN